MIKTMELNHATQMNAMQNRLIDMERAQNNRFQNKPNNDWQREGPQDQRPPNPFDSVDIVTGGESVLSCSLLIFTFQNKLLVVFIYINLNHSM